MEPIAVLTRFVLFPLAGAIIGEWLALTLLGLFIPNLRHDIGITIGILLFVLLVTAWYIACFQPADERPG